MRAKIPMAKPAAPNCMERIIFPSPLFGQINNNNDTFNLPDFLKAKPRRSQANDFLAAAQVCVARSIRRFSAPFISAERCHRLRRIGLGRIARHGAILASLPGLAHGCPGSYLNVAMTGMTRTTGTRLPRGPGCPIESGHDDCSRFQPTVCLFGHRWA